jgi:hypothetical protein
MRYCVLVENDCNDLQAKVNEFLAAGWTCQGGISVVVSVFYDRNNNPENNWVYYQAMVTETVGW